jgi:hypothetical protein
MAGLAVDERAGWPTLQVGVGGLGIGRVDSRGAPVVVSGGIGGMLTLYTPT